MLKSMTGYGRSDRQNGHYACKVEIRSVNNRFIEINTRLPKYLAALEVPLKKLIKSQCARGSFEVFVNLDKSDTTGGDLEVKPNLGLASQYFEAFKQIQSELGLKGEISMDSLLGMKEVIKSEPPTLDASQEKFILESVETALASLMEMRTEEGKNLQTDLESQIQAIHQRAAQIKERQPAVIEEYRKRLNDKISNLTEGAELDEARLAQETALLADRSDVTEEIIRLESHLEQFRGLFRADEPIGRKMEFITQEINREVNTIGSKSVDLKVSQHVIEIKSLLEKIREQLQNIE
ncbi:MAG: YicC family protein [Nitrospinaceae bacterium]|nr:YicC family protein [Nitrospinaceae bacterium]NIR54826.1 YicC family protein [Nitrospinaceae bacterium]NIS85251.1 YicC family protein [Nitrospinaceae bacterium]NIT82064.1 YicC family protein [Nitrospinaceae bacterium]NIU44325.1 YicC family protein [Nitrospinaceae bacterium]